MNISSATLSAEMQAVARVAGSTSIHVIDQIENTVDAYVRATEAFNSINELIDVTCTKLKAYPVQSGVYLDPDDKIIGTFERAYKVLEAELPKLLLAKSAEQERRDIPQEFVEPLVDEFDRLMQAVATTVESLKDLRAGVITHDLKAEPRDPDAYGSMDQVISALHN
ncbi:MAG: hypothetical protein ACK5RJ_09995 [Burkholderiales bacterium]|jgi:hypothetical protein|nr:hypothetical protein [Rhodocyclaceae bacterium]MCA3022479.1 hypothetical protein [Rhodocyclaceae bacterium]MCA3053323.1 hypothetical protein [Rhodocyclaceae bacterium]